MAARVTEIAPGVYRYQMSTHTLRTVPGTAPDELAQAYEQPEFAERAAAGLLLTVELGRAVPGITECCTSTWNRDAEPLPGVHRTGSGCAVAGFTEAPLHRLAALPEPNCPPCCSRSDGIADHRLTAGPQV